jgi:hypothetical protein
MVESDFQTEAGRCRDQPHDDFLVQRAISTSGHLTWDEKRRLKEHRAVRSSCSKAGKQYNAVASKTIPAVAPGPESVESDP